MTPMVRFGGACAARWRVMLVTSRASATLNSDVPPARDSTLPRSERVSTHVTGDGNAGKPRPSARRRRPGAHAIAVEHARDELANRRVHAVLLVEQHRRRRREAALLNPGEQALADHVLRARLSHPDHAPAGRPRRAASAGRAVGAPRPSAARPRTSPAAAASDRQP